MANAGLHAACPTGNILYVKANATGANDGSSWANAFTDLQNALESTCPGITQIWVAAGTYKPANTNDRDRSFYMKDGVGLYGGFNGSETLLSQRNWTTNVTILSGEIGTNGAADNSYSVVSFSLLDNTTILDGFTITAGSCNGGVGYQQYGGGIYDYFSNAIINNCTITGNSGNIGAGMYSYRSITTVNNCVFSGNIADISGAGVFATDTDITFNRCSFLGNTAQSNCGGVYNSYSNSTLTNCIFSGNESGTNGGGLYNLYSSPRVTNCTFAGNKAYFNGGAIYNISSTSNVSAPVLLNCIIWGNSSGMNYGGGNYATVTYSIIQNSVLYPGEGNLEEDPLFVSQPPVELGTSGNLRLQACSPAREAGTSVGAPLVDADGNPRPVGIHDMGAYEFQGTNPMITYYADVDGDGFGSSSSTQTTVSCIQPPGYVTNNLDCNDNNPNIKPGATEVCDGVDNNCNSQTDEGVQTTYYRDLDGDGFGNPAVTQMACSQPTGYVTNNTDCNDNSALEKPGQVWYKDTDGDGYAQTGAATITQCLRPTGYKVASELASATGDCNDANAAIRPGATEVCDGIDNDCDNMTDEGVQTTYYRDMDGDGFGNPAVTQMACSIPTGYVSNNTDCNDNSALEKPGQVWYKDTDNDGYGQTGAATITQCVRPTGYKAASELTATTGDCNDSNAAIKPGAIEICDGIDNDCDNMTDEGVQTTYYRDADGDGFGNPAVTQMACSQPTGYVTNNTDCNDNSALERPGQVWYKDTDDDGYGQTGAPTITQCARPSGYKIASELTATTGDCNDNNNAINPAATEVCDGIDNNCNNQTDESGFTMWYRDQDGDGFGNPAMTQSACSAPAGYVANNTDCNDNNALEKPGQVWYADADNDGYSSGATLTQCLRPTNYKVASELTATTGDCNDNAAAIHPAAVEVCDGIDNNCNSQTDEGVLTTYYRDQDGDGFGNPAMTQSACSAPAGYVANNTDCNDNNALEKPGQIWYADADNDGYSSGTTLTQCLRPTNYKIASELTAITGDCNDNNAAVRPGVPELCDGIDNNCNNTIDEGGLTYYRDQDGDGFGNPAVTEYACVQPTGYVTNNADCNDNSALEKPGQVWYKDTDNDGYAQTGAATITQCVRPAGYKVASELTATTGDCNDNAAVIHPAAAEVCDEIDNDCNGQTDEPQAIGGAWSSNGIGSAGADGETNISCSGGGSSVYNISASGFSTSSSDQLNMVSQMLCGNGEIIARVAGVASGGWAGVTLRESLAPGSKKVALKTQLSNMIRREIRTATNAPVNLLNINRPTHVWLRLVRNGSSFTGYTSANGSAWDFAFTATVSMSGCIYAGLFAESINGNVETTASFGDVSIIGNSSSLGSSVQNLVPALDGLEVSVYPNPNNGEVTLAVKGTEDRPLNLKVMDAFGKIIRNIELNEGAAFNYSLDLSGEPAGIYYLRLRSESGVENVQRVVVQH